MNICLLATTFGEEEALTVVKVSTIDGTRADSNEKHTLFAVLGNKFGYRHIQASFADRIRCVLVDVVLGDPVILRDASRYSQDLLGLALENEWQKEVEEMDVSNDIGFEGIEQVFLKALWLFTTYLAH